MDEALELHRLAFRACCEDLPEYYHHKYEHPITPEEVETYAALTFFDGWKIYQAFDFFAFTTRNRDSSPSTNVCVPIDMLCRRMPAIWVSPFKDRLMKQFSSDQTDVSFEDFLDMMSAFSAKCPKYFKYVVAFKMFDFDEDDVISLEDLKELLRRLTDSELHDDDYTDAANYILFLHDKDGDEYLNINEFIQMLEKCPDFADMFYHTTRLVRDLRYF